MRHSIVLAAGVLTILAACAEEPQTGAVEPHWDRDACERCRMVLSERNYAAQVRFVPPGKKRSRVLWFDDIGCATLWLDEQPWADDPGVEIWVTDRDSGQWIEARGANYLVGNVTPMAYGIAASAKPLDGGLDFEQAKQHIRTVEQRFNVRDAHLLEQAKARAAAASPAIGEKDN